MANIRKQMAKLNPRSMPLVVSGARGTRGPELDATDVAAALAASGGDPKRRLAITVLCLRWWPAAVEGPGIARYQTVERKGKDGKPEMVREYAGEEPVDTQMMRQVLGLLRRCLLRYAMKLPEGMVGKVTSEAFLDRWARVVIDEYRHPHVCPACAPFGHPGSVPKAMAPSGKVTGFEWALCDACGGTGTQPWGRDRRAGAVRMRAATFREHLESGHAGALLLLRELEFRAVQMVGKKFD